MSRRRQQPGDAEISSDSFLDIIANIVGILIILIVVAGLRVSQAPLIQQAADDEAVQEPALASQSDPEFEVPGFAVGTTDAAAWDPKIPAPVQPEPADPVVIDLTQKIDPALLERYRQQVAEREKLQAQFASLKSAYASAAAENTEAQESLNAASARLNELNQQLVSAKQVYDSEKARSRLQSDSLQEQQDKILRMQTLLDDAKQKNDELAREQEPDTVILRHDMTPVSQVTQDHELHFMVLNDRVAEVPMDLLSKELERQIKARREWLLKSNSHTGEIGPIHGFRMQYLVQKDMLSTLDQLRNGNNMVRISLNRFVIVPDEESLLMESYPEAAGSTSRFLISVRSAPPGTTCTFWVYPESFETYQKLKQLVHQSNLRVAGRPLPAGMPISGSPSGSRSAAQ